MTHSPPTPHPVSLRDRLLCLAGVALLVPLFLLVSTVARYAGIGLCGFHALTGFSCPGCGATRALGQLFQGHWAEAFRLNPILISLLPLAVYGIVWVARPRPPRTAVRPVWLGALVVVGLLFAVLRNLPVQPWAGLAP